MTIRTSALLLSLAVAAGCAGAPVPKAAAPAAPVAPTPTPPPLTSAELKALEGTPGSTPPLPEEVEPASAAIAGLDGTPGPSPASGPADAPVRIYLFTDFQCPVCFRVVEPVKLLLRQHPKDVRLVVKQNAIPSHRDAARLAGASLAAFRAGKFWPFQDRLFADRSRRSDADLTAHAGDLGLDVARFERDREDEAVTAQVRYERALAKTIGFTGTPGFVVNGVTQQGWGSYNGLEALVQRELRRAGEIAAEGVPADRVSCEATRRSGPKGELLAEALCGSPK